MRIACPNCAAAYEVPDAALAAGPRLLRCARCGHRFTATGPASPAAPPPAPEVANPPARGAIAAGHETPPPSVEAAAPSAVPPASVAPDSPDPAVATQAAPARGRGAGVLRPERRAAEAGPAPPLPELAVREPLLAPTPTPPRGALLLAWLVSLGTLGGIGWAAWRYRSAIIEAWPPAERFFALFGSG